MFNLTKYVVMRDRMSNTEVAFVFSNLVVHADVGRRMYGEPVSAGFVIISPDCEVKVTGRSESLNLDNRGELDEEIIKRAFNW